MTDVPSETPAADSIFRRPAAAALLISQLPWLFAITEQFKTGLGSVAAWNLAVTVVEVALAAGLWIRHPKAWQPALVATYYNLGASALWAFKAGHPVAWIAAGLGAVAIFLVSRSRSAFPVSKPVKGAPPPEKPPELSQWLRENIEAIVVAFVMALIIRCFCIEVFKIPSASMQPTLMGDQKDGDRILQGGDRIMVTKFYYALSAVERFDILVFRFPLNQARNFIKRVVGLPGEELLIHSGDIYTKPKGTKEFVIARKPFRIQDSVWIDAVHPINPPEHLADRDAFNNNWEMVPDVSGHAAFEVQAGQISTRESAGRSDSKFVLRAIRDGDGGSPPQDVADVRIAFDVEISGPRGEVFAQAIGEHGRFEARLSTEEPGVLVHHAPGSENGQPTKSISFRGAKMKMDRRYRLELAVFDGTVCARVDGVVQAQFDFITTLSDAKEKSRPASSDVFFGSRGVTFRARRLDVGRDLCHRGKDYGVREGQTIPIPEDSYVMMGDNVNNSHDSRSWVRKEYALKDGGKIVCEGQEVMNSTTDLREIQEKYGLPTLPAVRIKLDEHGNEWALYTADPGDLPPGAPARVLAKPDPDSVPFPCIDRKFIVGKGFWIWWPQGRWFRIIR